MDSTYDFTGLGIPYEGTSLLNRPAGWNYALHKHLCFEFTLVIKDASSITIDEKEHILTRGMVTPVPPGIYHIQQSKAGFRRLGIWLSSYPEDSLIKILSSNINYPLIATIPYFLEFIPAIEEHLHFQTLLSTQKLRNILENILLCCVDHVKKQDKTRSFGEN